MNALIKYFIISICLALLSSPIGAQKKNTKTSSSSLQKKKNTAKKKYKKKSNKKKFVNLNKKSNSSNKKDVILLTKKVDDLSLLLNTSAIDIKPSKTDSIPEKVVTIISSFKPQLKNAAKINIVNAVAINDTSSLSLNYQVPSQNLSFQYRPISLTPRSFKNEALKPLENNFSLKVGYGNYLQHLIDINVNLNTTHNTHSIHLLNEAISGEHPLQTYQRWGLNYINKLSFNENNQLYTQFFIQNINRYRYGLVPDSTLLPKTNFEQNFTHFGGSFRLQNKLLSNNNYDLNPILKFENTNGLSNSNNLWLSLNAPIYFKLQNNSKLNFNIEYTFNKFTSSSNVNNNNTLLLLNPSIELNKWDLNVLVGFTPVFSNNIFNVFPKIIVEKKLKDTNFKLVGGWYRIFNNNSLGNILAINPWIASPSEFKIFQKNRKHLDLIVNLSKKINYQLSLSYNDSRNYLLFNRYYNSMNTNTNGLFYQALFEHRVKTIEFESTISYRISDQLLLRNYIKYVQFDFLRDNLKPWGILPFEVNSSFIFQPMSKWVFDGSLNYWTGAPFINNNNKAENLKNVLILNTGFQYTLTNKWTLWAKGENLLNKKYERWGDYPSLGVQFIAGIKYSFRK